MSTAIFKMHEEHAQNPSTGWKAGTTGEMWVVECSRLRADGNGAGEPGVHEGDTLFVVFLPSKQAVAECRVEGKRYERNHGPFGAWYVNVRIVHRNFDGPVVGRFGITNAQGSLQRITEEQGRRIAEALRK
jgi:hypothetical protein